MRNLFKIIFLIFVFSGCMQRQSTDSSIHNKLVIAHRGTTYWAPEETEAAMRWARNAGADYLEFDLQRTADGYLIALHDDDLRRTTDVEQKFPNRKEYKVSAFTYKELLTLDAGSWFNKSVPQNGRPAFSKMDILSLEDVINIAEGRKIKRDEDGKRIVYSDNGKVRTEYLRDEQDNFNRPGIYVETKVPSLFPGIEADLKKELERLGWYNDDSEKLKKIEVRDGKVKIGNTEQRLILQTFSKKSLIVLNKIFSDYVPICFLLWQGSDEDDIKENIPTFYEEAIRFGKSNGADIIGPSISGGPNNYPELLTVENYKIIKNYNLQIHGYSFDTEEQMKTYERLVDGLFTNRTELTLNLIRGENLNAINILDELGY